jgi:hypothetical protein
VSWRGGTRSARSPRQGRTASYSASLSQGGPHRASPGAYQLALRSGKGRSGTENQQSGFEYGLRQFSPVLAQIFDQLSRSRPQVINRTVHPCERQIEQNLAPFVADIELPVASLHLGLPHQLTGELGRVFACRPRHREERSRRDRKRPPFRRED